MNLSPAQASNLIDIAALGLLTLALANVLSRRLATAIALIALQGVLLGVATGAAALAEHHWRAWVAFAVALGVKAVAIPLILRFVLGRLTLRREVEVVVPVKLAFPMGVGLALIAYRVAAPFTRGDLPGVDSRNAVPAAIALLLLGLFTMITRKKALSQVIGLVTMENGLYLAAVTATRGLPLVVEIGVAMDVLTGVALMGLVTHEMHQLFATTNTDRLSSLRD